MINTLHSKPSNKKIIAFGVGAATLLGALTGPKLLAQNSATHNTPSEPVTSFSGPLANVTAPKYDGPVQWGGIGFDKFTGAVVGGIGGALAGIVLIPALDSNSRRGLSGLGALSCIAGGAILGGVALSAAVDNSTYSLSFPTQIAEVPMSAPSHYEKHGKTTSGPYYAQVLYIKESPIPLAANAQKAPFMPGQKIQATFHIDNKTHQVVSWTAEPGVR